MTWQPRVLGITNTWLAVGVPCTRWQKRTATRPTVGLVGNVVWNSQGDKAGDVQARELDHRVVLVDDVELRVRHHDEATCARREEGKESYEAFVAPLARVRFAIICDLKFTRRTPRPCCPPKTSRRATAKRLIHYQRRLSPLLARVNVVLCLP